MRLRIALCIEALTVGGAEQMLVALANGLAARGHEIHLICLSSPGELVAGLAPEIRRVQLAKQPGMDFRLIPSLRSCIRRIAPDVVNSHLWVANLWSRLSLMGSALPVIVTEHSRDSWKPPHYRWLDRHLSRPGAWLVAVSEDTAGFYRDRIGIEGRRIRVIPNGIDTRHFASGDGTALREQWSDGGEFLIGSVGRLVPAKNHERLIRAFSRLGRSTGDLPPMRLILVGEGPQRSHLQRTIREMGLSDQVVLAGARRDIPNVLDAFDVFVLPSDREGHPLTVIEAQAAGTPVIVTDVGGAAEAIVREGDRAAGVVVAPSSEALALALESLVRDPSRRSGMAAVARRLTGAQFDLEHMVTAYEALFLEVCRARGVKGR